MAKVLFICFQDFRNVRDGGSQGTRRNYDILCRSLGQQNVSVYCVNPPKRSLFSRLLSALLFPFGYFNGLTPAKVRRILLLAPQYDFVFINTSIYGLLAKRLKQNAYPGKIICFFHNVESIYYESRVNHHLPFRRVIISCAYRNDALALQYADTRIGLCQRDNRIMQQLHHRSFDLLSPVWFDDRCHALSFDPSALTSPRPKCFFIGSNFPANAEGLLWFVHNVLPFVQIDFRIIGKDMDKLQAAHPCLHDIPVFANVPDLSPFFLEADFMVLPIFSGSGMKVKTCESLMYGKNILGSTETFEGYDINPSLAGQLCNTADDYIRAIRHFSTHPIPRFNAYSRQLFLSRYSSSTALRTFQSLFSH